MRLFIAPILCASSLLLVPALANPAAADQMIQELRSTWAQPGAAAGSPATSADEQPVAAQRTTPTARRRKASGRYSRPNADQP